jgi:hypothetical protein
MRDVPARDGEVPEGDAVEQAQPVGEEPVVDRMPDDPEAPEADALEQAQEVPAEPEEDL